MKIQRKILLLQQDHMEGGGLNIRC